MYDNVIEPNSGSFLERLIFKNRVLILILSAVITILMASNISRLELGASFEKMIPQFHPFVENYKKHENDLLGLGDVVRIAVENPKGTIYDAEYLETLRRINDEIFLLPGVNRSQMKSLWTPTTRWTGVTEYGLEGGPVIPQNYNGSNESLSELAKNIERSGEVGQIVAENYQSSIIFVPLLNKNKDGERVDYRELGIQLNSIVKKYESNGVIVHVTGFAKLVSDLIDGLGSVMIFFAVTILIATTFIFIFTRCWRSTCAVVLLSLVAVVWLLGALPFLGYILDPYSILVPFLIFAIGLSHGSQKMNGILQNIGRGNDKLLSSRLTFRRLFFVGVTALLSDAIGFAVLLVIDIGAIQQLAFISSLGVAILIFTNLILLPIVLSFIGVSHDAAVRSLKAEQADASGLNKHKIWQILDLFTQRNWAIGIVTFCAILGLMASYIAQGVQVGDLDPGAPELRAESRYNQDVQFINSVYGASSDVLAVMVTTPPGECSDYETLNKVDDLEWRLRQVSGVEGTKTLSLLNRQMLVGLNEGNPKWYELNQNQQMLNLITSSASRGLYNDSCSLLTLYIYLSDHESDTLNRVVETIEIFSYTNNTDDVKFILAAGSAGIQAATNIVVADAWNKMTYLVFGAVFILCMITFRSWRAVLIAMLPLFLVSKIAEALMVFLGIGIKVSTLPVIALGVGIGVDYALYILSVTLANIHYGRKLADAYYQALIICGKVVILIGITLAIGVSTWVLSPIKFQADMGLMLAFMFVGNMVAALILIPSLSYFLLSKKIKNLAS